MAFSLSETTLLSAVKGGSLTSIMASVLKPGYGITFETIDSNSKNPLNGTVGSTVFSPTSWIGFERTSDASIATAPTEKGQFNSYNKVRRPGEIKLAFTLEGWTGYSGAIPNLTNLTTLSREELIHLLDTMIACAYTYTIETPDTSFSSCDLIHYDYQIKEGRGVTLLSVNAYFQEVVITSETITSSNAKSSDSAAMSTITTQSSVTNATLKDVSNALTSGSQSLSSVLSTTTTYVTSEITSAATSVASAWESVTSEASAQITSGVSKLVSSVVT